VALTVTVSQDATPVTFTNSPPLMGAQSEEHPMNKCKIAERAAKASPSPTAGIARMAQYCHSYWLTASLHLLMYHVSAIPLDTI